MADEKDPKTTDHQVQEPASQKKTEEPGPVPYDRFKTVNDELKTARDQLKALMDASEKQKEKEAAEQGKWKDLFEKRDQEYKSLETKLNRTSIALEAGLPIEMAERVQGATPEEMKADAEKLVAFLKPVEGPGLPPKQRHGTSPDVLDINSMSAEDIRKNRDKLLSQKQ